MRKFKRLFSGIVAFIMLFSVLQLSEFTKVYGVTAVNSITFVNQPSSILIGETVKITPTIDPINAETDNGLVWTAANAYATVDTQGNVTGIAEGIAAIRVTCGSVNKIFKITVKDPAKLVSNVQLTETSVKACIAQGQVSLTAIVNPDTATDKSVTWSSNNPAVADVADQSGTIQLNSVGIATITVQSINNPNAQATCEIQVLPQVTGISLDKTSITLEKKDVAQTATIKATLEPADAIQDVVYQSSDMAVVQIDPTTGKIYPTVRDGVATITVSSASNPSVFATCEVIVLPKITGIALDVSDIKISRAKREIHLLTTNVTPVGANSKVTFTSSDENVTKVNEDGLIIPVSGGTAIVTATSVSDPSIFATCNVTVTPEPTEVEINKSEVTLSRVKGETAQLTAKVLPSDTEQEVEYSSDDPKVATVDANGFITAVSEGTATITIVSPYQRTKPSTCKVTVVGTPSMINLNKTEATLNRYKGETVQLAVDVIPAGSETDVTYSSSDANIATVDANGLVTPVSDGVAIITAKSKYDVRVVKTCTITVIGDPDSVKLNKTSAVLDLSREKNVTLESTVPEGTNPAVTYSSSDPKVAQVDAKGVVTGLSVGQATITVTTVEGNKTATCLVTVIDKEKMKPTITVDNEEDTYKPVKVTVTAPTDYPGLDLIEYNIDGSGWKIYKEPVEVKANCKFVAKTFDKFGNYSNFAQYEIKNIDNSKLLVLKGDVIDKNIFNKVQGVDITVEDTVNSAGVTLKWSFNGKDVKDTSKELDLKLNDVSKNKDVIESKYVNPLIISFVNHGELPAPMTIRILVDPVKFDVNKALNLYYYNEDIAEADKKIQEIQKGLIPEKDADGNYYVTVVLTHHSDYFLSIGEIVNTNPVIAPPVDPNGKPGVQVQVGDQVRAGGQAQVSQNGTLVQTGSPIDMKALLSLGFLSLAAGAIFIAKKRR
ncbi:Ig-like domain-containing protein [Clostridium cellulovorans]|uniref:Ig domain protein group 2 domain protein n=1 Tax=Clostridium cellulovorans (strain ATCC 35296 / DSM 3052 / OCM 3 / 743B) TaxID=573061 RepID=D9SUA7_CLOC7|nr:Ig-like domain-containing protein [Clostridium cellulovorans]ADL52862.1 Ig domain protein group 2 domain protein [Clostridium cellulovorans 743B]